MNEPEKLSKNFVRGEFRCKCGCGFDAVDWQLVESLQMVRDTTGRPVVINSACRCEAHNRAIGGKRYSQHLYGKAADIRIPGYTIPQVEAVINGIEAFRNGGIGVYKDFIHCDVRNTGKARWNG